MREVWVFFPKGGPKPKLIRTMQAICRGKGWQCQLKPTTSARSWHGRIPLLSASDADTLYRRMHIRRVAVLSIQRHRAVGPFLCKRPDTNYCLRRNEVVSLREYCRHKSFFRRLFENSQHPERWVGDFDHWCRDFDCEGEHDPRCLPLHVFSSRSGAPRRLLHADGRQLFEQEHTARGGRQDLERNIWAIANPPHGRDQLHVAGTLLPQGFHWDVSPRRRETRFYTPLREWLVREYINIYPNAHLRGQSPYAVKKE